MQIQGSQEERWVIRSVNFKNSCNPEAESCFMQWEFLGLQVKMMASQVTLRDMFQGGGGEVSGYTEVCNKGQVGWTSEVFLWIKENQISQVKEFSTLLHKGKCKSLGSLKPFLSCASQLPGASIVCFLDPEFLSAHQREWLQPEGCQITGISLLPECP